MGHRYIPSCRWRPLSPSVTTAVQAFVWCSGSIQQHKRLWAYKRFVESGSHCLCDALWIPAVPPRLHESYQLFQKGGTVTSPCSPCFRKVALNVCVDCQNKPTSCLECIKEKYCTALSVLNTLSCVCMCSKHYRYFIRTRDWCVYTGEERRIFFPNAAMGSCFWES